jgi:AcrR family transcriptional regulator
MPLLSRKQRELIEREQLILDVAQNMLHQHGFSQLTMDRVAEAVEYSKGTIYNHFSSKEDLICAMCCRCINKLIELFENAARYPGNTRERFSAIGLGYVLYYQQNPMELQYIQIVKSYAIREKISKARLSELDSLEQQLTGIAMAIVNEAIAGGDIDEQYNNMADSIVFGFWSLHYGAVLLEQSDIPLTDLGFSPVMQMIWMNAQKFLDGFEWKPNSQQINSQQLFTQLTTNLFAVQHINNKQEQGIPRERNNG